MFDLNKDTDISLFTRILKRTLHVNEVFFAFKEKFSAILEDPKGDGKHFLVSKAGVSRWLQQGDDAEVFFDAWKRRIQPACCDFPAIQQLIYAAYEVCGVLEHLPVSKTLPASGMLWLHEAEWSICFDSASDTVYLASRISEQQLDDIECLLVHCRGRKAPIKTLIMDAHVVVGVGNIYAAESLFLAGIHPMRAAGRISKQRLQVLVDAIKATLAAAIEAGGSSISDFVQVDGKPGYFAHNFHVYGREGESCTACDAKIRKITQAGRSSFYCSNCQH